MYTVYRNDKHVRETTGGDCRAEKSALANRLANQGDFDMT